MVKVSPLPSLSRLGGADKSRLDDLDDDIIDDDEDDEDEDDDDDDDLDK